MKHPKLRESIESILSRTPLPEVDWQPDHAKHRQLFLLTLRTRSGSAPKLLRRGLGYQLRTAISLVSVGLLVLIGGGTLLAIANRAQPGQPLYSLNRALERTQLALTQNEADKLALKINFAEERLAEIAAADLSQPEITAEVATSTAQALAEIDDQLDQTKIALVLNETTELSHEDVGQIDAQLKQVLENYQLDTAELFRATENTDLADIVATISDVEEGLLSRPTTEGEGFYLRLSGRLSVDAQRLAVFERELMLNGSLDARALGGQDVKLNGWFSREGLAAEMINFKQGQLALHMNQTVLSYSAELQQDEDGLFVVGPNQERINLTGEVTQDERVVELVGQRIGFNATWQEGEANLIDIVAQTENGEIILPERTDPDTETSGEALPNMRSSQPDEQLPSLDD